MDPEREFFLLFKAVSPNFFFNKLNKFDSPFMKEALSNTDFLYLGWGEEIKSRKIGVGMYLENAPIDSDMIKDSLGELNESNY